MKKRNLFLSALLTLLVSTPVVSMETLMQDIRNTATVVGITAGLAGIGYVAGRAGSYLNYTHACTRFSDQIGLLNNKWLIHSESELKKQIKESIFKKHESIYFMPSVYRNYPLVKYKDDLDWYIARLWALQIFHAGTDMYGKILELVTQLKELRSMIVTDYEFIKERRKFDEGIGAARA